VDSARDYWDGQAATFDDEPDHGLRDPGVRRAWRMLLAQNLPPAPARIADLGCGTGTLSILLAEQGHLVRGVDLSREMVARARLKAAQNAGLEASFSQGDAADPPLEPGGFDVVLSRHVLWAMPERDVASPSCSSTGRTRWCVLWMMPSTGAVRSMTSGTSSSVAADPLGRQTRRLGQFRRSEGLAEVPHLR
jgi:SAM-dependent methyltransferase